MPEFHKILVIDDDEGIKSFDREELTLAVRNVFQDSRRRGKAR